MRGGFLALFNGHYAGLLEHSHSNLHAWYKFIVRLAIYNTNSGSFGADIKPIFRKVFLAYGQVYIIWAWCLERKGELGQPPRNSRLMLAGNGGRSITDRGEQGVCPVTSLFSICRGDIYHFTRI